METMGMAAVWEDKPSVYVIEVDKSIPITDQLHNKLNTDPAV